MKSSIVLLLAIAIVAIATKTKDAKDTEHLEQVSEKGNEPSNKHETNQNSGCPFANILSKHEGLSNGRTEKYKKALKLERITKMIKAMKKENQEIQHSIRKREAFWFNSRDNRFPSRGSSRRYPIRQTEFGNRYTSSSPRNTIRRYPAFRKDSRYYHASTKSFPPNTRNQISNPTQRIIKQSSISDADNVQPHPASAQSESIKPSMSLTDKESKNQSINAISADNEQNESQEFDCPLEKSEAIDNCKPDHLYRSFSGRCNNLDTDTSFGKHSSIFKRLLHSEYDNNISNPRKKSKRGGELPNPRSISSIVHEDNLNHDHHHTLALMQWGQFLDHDITLTPFIDALAQCEHACDENKLSENTHDGVIGPCFSIPVPKNDKYYPDTDEQTKSQKCLPLIRSSPGQTILGPREQFNAITAYIDSSNLYGSDPCMSHQLREHVGGRMKALKHPMSPKIFKPLMPRHAHHPECVSPTGKCFMTGDDRNSEHPGLVSMHTMMLREHNRIAKEMEIYKPNWSDEKVFQETRKIIIAINQHITYNEFLPRVLGPKLMKHFGLQIDHSSNGTENRYNGYDNQCSADIFNEFATAAFRFGHSLIKPGFDLIPEPNSTAKHLSSFVQLRDNFFQPDVTFGVHIIDKLLRGMVNVPMERMDRSITSEVTQHLFEKKGVKYSGQDLAALNIQRGRDHGLPGYSKYLKRCSALLPNDAVSNLDFKTFEDLNAVMNEEASSILSTVYDEVDDIDLFTGGLSETPYSDALVGRTFGCIIGLQFQKLKTCDRFWYETPNLNIGFTDAQLEEIKKVSLSSIMCRSWDVASPIQMAAFDLPDSVENPIRPCLEENHPAIDMRSYWKNASHNPTRPFELAELGRTDTSSVSTCDIGGRIMKSGSEVRISACTICSCLAGGSSQCYSEAIKSCEDLTNEYGQSAIAVDISCRVQCPDLVQQADLILSLSPIVPE